MNKIKLNDEVYLKFIDSKLSSEVKIIGAYGCFKANLDFVRRFFERDVPDIYDSVTEGIILFKKQDEDIDKVVAVYKCPDPLKLFSF